MPWQKGIGSKIYKNVGRKGYEIEKKQLDKMSKAVDIDLNLVLRVQKGEANDQDYKKLSALQVRISKYLDKLHPSKQENKDTSDYPILLK